ncbi:MAG TPA: FHA domain-containing protein [Vicinamibacteria bacterium]|nr:FHA domain-containing protein [Vicinamibacteria bacterium]
MLVVRVLRDGVVVREELFRSTPVTIGRSPSCHLVLTDPSVSREHARIDRDPGGGFVIVDGSGTNGLYAGPRRVASERISGRLRARLGLAEIEIEEVSADATQPISLEDLHRLDQRRTPITWAKYLAITLAALVIETVMEPEFWSPWNSQRAVGVVWQCMTALVAILVFASILLGLLKAAGRRVRMADVLNHFAVYAWLGPLSVALSMAAYYVLSDGLASSLRSWLPSLAAVVFLTQAAAIRRPGSNAAFRWRWGAAFLLVLIGIDLTRAYASRKMGEPEPDHTMQAPIPVLGPGPAISFEDYGASVDAAGKRSEAQVR